MLVLMHAAFLFSLVNIANNIFGSRIRLYIRLYVHYFEPFDSNSSRVEISLLAHF